MSHVRVLMSVLAAIALAVAALDDDAVLDSTPQECESTASGLASQRAGPSGGMIFFLATPSTGSSTIDHLFTDVMKTVQLGGRAGGKGGKPIPESSAAVTSTHSGPNPETWPAMLFDRTACASGLPLEVG